MDQAIVEEVRPQIVPRRGMILAAALMAIFMPAAESSIVATALPTIIGDLGGFELFSWVFAVPGSLVGRGEHYALEVAGDSMVDAGILDGDTVIVQRCDTAENGSIVVALVDNVEVTLKRLRRRGASIALEPANQAYETRIFGPDRVKVQGRLVGLLRRY